MDYYDHGGNADVPDLIDQQYHFDTYLAGSDHHGQFFYPSFFGVSAVTRSTFVIQ